MTVATHLHPAPSHSRRSPHPARVPGTDLLRLGMAGIRARPLRVVLSAVGIAIGIAAMVSVVGISSSSSAEVDARLNRLGTNLLRVSPGSTVFGENASLPEQSLAMVSRIAPVRTATQIAGLQAHVYRTSLIPSGQTNSITVVAAGEGLTETLGARMYRGAWLNQATAHYPGVVLGAAAAGRLGVDVPGTRLWLGGRWFSLTGVLESIPLASELDSAAMIGIPAARTYLGFDGHPTTIYVRTDPDRVEQVRAVLGATANPQTPMEVRVSRPSDVLAAQRATRSTLNGLLLGLGLVALVVGGIGVANTMVISVLERRAEIGLRRALGASRAHVRTQFLTESLLLSLLGGVCGTAMGAAVTASYALIRSWPTAIPLWAIVGGVCATLPIGILSGLYPAVRASLLAPANALATT